MRTERAFVMVWDGLRPDLVSEQVTPHLFRLAQAGVWFDRSSAVYPTLTRANAPAIATGCRPGRAGVPGNSFCLPATGSLTPFSTGDAANLRRLAASDGRPILLVDTLADRVHRAGGRTVIVSSGSPGCALLQHPRAAACGDLILSVGLPEMSPHMERLGERFGAPPPRRVPDTAWDAYSTRMITEYVLPELEPTLLVFWHTDPDHTTHDRGFSAPETVQALRDADENLGAILATYDRLSLRESTAVVVTSDHGGSTVTRRVRPAADLAGLLSDGAAAENGGSAFIYSADPATVALVRQLDYVGPVFTRHGDRDTFPLSLVGLDGPRAPDIVCSFAWQDAVVNGFAGTSVGTHGKLVVDHGTCSPYDIRNTLVGQGPDFRDGWVDPVPVGNIDIAPTLTHLLRLDSGTPFDGRVLFEALVGGGEAPAWQTETAAVAFSARGADMVQRLTFEVVGEHRYLVCGWIESV